MTPVLVVVGGLPATGKSTVATLVARLLRAPYLRVDRVEQAIVDWSPLEHPVGVAGYGVTYALAREQLTLGLDVVVECVNPLAVTRDAWVATAADASAGIVEVELVCGNADEHRRRVETRTSDVDGLVKPTWAEVAGREYEPWSRGHLRIDTARSAPVDAAGTIVEEVEAARLRAGSLST